MRLIDADALIDNVESSKYNNPHTNGRVRINHINEHDHFGRMIYDAPTVDAVEVVRCRECDWGKGELICANPKCGKSWYGCPVPPEHYCSYGERSEGE